MRARPLLLPLGALAALLAVHAFLNPGFFRVEVVDGRLVGSLVDVADRAAPVLLLSLGMALVIATGGIDLSVGAVMALAGSVAAALLVEAGWPLPAALGAALAAGAAAGAFNGALVAALGLQPIVATLVLMVAGRGVAQLLTDGQVVGLEREAGFAVLGGGHLLGLPVPLWIAAGAFAAAALLARGTALGAFVRALGSNEAASRLAGLPVGGVKVAVYALSGLFAGAAGLVYASDITAADANNAGLYLELDAILAAVIGGAALNGGRLHLLGAALGALALQTLTTTLLVVRVGGREVPPELNLAVKALAVLAVCLLQSDALRAGLRRRRAP